MGVQPTTHPKGVKPNGTSVRSPNTPAIGTEPPGGSWDRGPRILRSFAQPRSCPITLRVICAIARAVIGADAKEVPRWSGSCG
jgi:hypothetical protein